MAEYDGPMFTKFIRELIIETARLCDSVSPSRDVIFCSIVGDKRLLQCHNLSY